VSAWGSQLIEQHLDDGELERRWLELYREVAPRREDLRRAVAAQVWRTGDARRVPSSMGALIERLVR
jgi:hypothetical protein